MVGIIYITGKNRAVYREAVNLLGSQCLSQCRVAVKLLKLRIYVEAFFFYIGLEAILGGGGLCNTDDLAIQVFNGLDSGIVVYQKANCVRVIRGGEIVGFFSFIGNGEGCDNQVDLAVFQKRSSGLCGNTLEFYQLLIFRFLRSASEDLTCNVVSQVILKALIFAGCGVLKGEVWNIRFASYF